MLQTPMASGGECRDSTSFPLFGRLLRDPSSVEALAGVAPPAPVLRPVTLTAVPDRVVSVHEAVTALTQSLHECTLLANQEVASARPDARTPSDVYQENVCTP